MKSNNLTKLLLTLVALLLSANLIRPFLDGAPSHAQSQDQAYAVYIERSDYVASS